jgi:hypothetical protein
MGLYVDERAAREFAFISEQLSAAQRDLNTHTLNLAGTCITCRGYGCGQRESALARFSYYSRLPARVPMNTAPDRIFVRPIPVTA